MDGLIAFECLKGPGVWWQIGGYFNEKSEQVGLTIILKKGSQCNHIYHPGYDLDGLLKKAMVWVAESKTVHMLKGVSSGKVTSLCNREFKNGPEHWGSAWEDRVNCSVCLSVIKQRRGQAQDVNRQAAQAAKRSVPKPVSKAKKKTVQEALALVDGEDIW